MDPNTTASGLQMHLTFLPPEVFGILACKLGLNDISRLLMTGDVQLTRRLAQKGSVTSLEGLEYDFVGILLLPSFPHLCRLDLNVSPDSLVTMFDDDGSSRFGFLHWPKTLTSIEIWTDFLDNEVADELTCLLTPIRFNVGQKLPNLCHLGLPIFLGNQIAEWASTWPTTIDSLKIWHLDPEWLLPSALTQLTLYDQSHWTHQLSDHSLPHLMDLNLRIEDVSEDNSIRPSLEDWQALPRALRWLEIRMSRVGDYYPLSFPPMLTWLSLNLRIEPNAIFPLPTTLSTFRFTTEEYIDASFLDKLPASLINLSISNYLECFLTKPLKLPPNLEKFDAPKITFSSFSALQSIPSTITSLAISVDPDVDKKPDWQPNKIVLPSLRSFCCKQAICPLWIFQCLRHSPHLSEIYLNRTHPIISSPIYAYMSAPELARDEIIVPPAFSHTHLETPIPLFTHYLTALYIPIGLIGDQFVQQLPTSLTSLNLPNSPYITDASIFKAIGHCKSLVCLILQTPNITGDAFKALPRGNLKIFCLPTASSILDEHIADLPRTITRLHLHAANKLTDACGPYIPPKLEHFEVLHNPLITEALASFMVVTKRTYLKAQKLTAFRNNICELRVDNLRKL